MAFFAQKTVKIDQNEKKMAKKMAKSKPLIIFFEIWYVLATQQKKMLQKKLFFDFSFFWPFLARKQPKLTNNFENLQNPNRLIKFSEI